MPAIEDNQVKGTSIPHSTSTPFIEAVTTTQFKLALPSLLFLKVCTWLLLQTLCRLIINSFFSSSLAINYISFNQTAPLGIKLPLADNWTNVITIIVISSPVMAIRSICSLLHLLYPWSQSGLQSVPSIDCPLIHLVVVVKERPLKLNYFRTKKMRAKRKTKRRTVGLLFICKTTTPLVIPHPAEEAKNKREIGLSTPFYEEWNI